MTQTEAQQALSDRYLYGYTGSHLLDALIATAIIAAPLLIGYFIGWASDSTRD